MAGGAGKICRGRVLQAGRVAGGRGSIFELSVRPSVRGCGFGAAEEESRRARRRSPLLPERRGSGNTLGPAFSGMEGQSTRGKGESGRSSAGGHHSRLRSSKPSTIWLLSRI